VIGQNTTKKAIWEDDDGAASSLRDVGTVNELTRLLLFLAPWLRPSLVRTPPPEQYCRLLLLPLPLPLCLCLPLRRALPTSAPRHRHHLLPPRRPPRRHRPFLCWRRRQNPNPNPSISAALAAAAATAVRPASSCSPSSVCRSPRLQTVAPEGMMLRRTVVVSYHGGCHGAFPFEASLSLLLCFALLGAAAGVHYCFLLLLRIANTTCPPILILFLLLLEDNVLQSTK